MTLPSVDELLDDNPVNEESVEAAGKEWKDEPPDDEFTNILDAEEE